MRVRIFREIYMPTATRVWNLKGLNICLLGGRNLAIISQIMRCALADGCKSCQIAVSGLDPDLGAQNWASASLELQKASGTDEIEVRYHKCILTFLGSRNLSNTGRRLKYPHLEVFWSHMQSRTLQNPQMTTQLQKHNDQRLLVHIIQDHTFCPIWWKKKTWHYSRGRKQVGRLSGLEPG